MSKYTVMVMLDLDIELPEIQGRSRLDIFASIEKYTENTVKETLEKRTKSIKVKIIRTKFLGTAE